MPSQTKTRALDVLLNPDFVEILAKKLKTDTWRLAFCSKELKTLYLQDAREWCLFYQEPFSFMGVVRNGKWIEYKFKSSLDPPRGFEVTMPKLKHDGVATVVFQFNAPAKKKLEGPSKQDVAIM